MALSCSRKSFNVDRIKQLGLGLGLGQIVRFISKHKYFNKNWKYFQFARLMRSSDEAGTTHSLVI